jgi:acetyl-CoA carboxylase carboxyltransferase component
MGKSISVTFVEKNIRLTRNQVVIDPTINPDQMEMYADEDSRGGVLEPEGIVGIKYRREKQIETMARLDPTVNFEHN